MINLGPVTQILPQKRLSTQMCAILMIFAADPQLMTSVEPFVDLTTESVDWEGIHKTLMNSGYKAAVSFAFGLWTDRVLEGSNPFELALSMEPPLKRACLRAIALRCGLNT